MEQEEVEQARGVIRAVDRALGSAVGAGPPPEAVKALLEAARLAVPRKMVPHPCTIRCWRVGGACDIQEDGRCMECGSPGIKSDPVEFAKLCSPEVVLSLCESLVGMREVLGHPAVLAAAYSARDLR